MSAAVKTQRSIRKNKRGVFNDKPLLSLSSPSSPSPKLLFGHVPCHFSLIFPHAHTDAVSCSGAYAVLKNSTALSILFGRRGNLVLGLEVVQQNTALLALLTPVTHDDARAVDHLPGVALAVEHAQTGPLAQHLSVRHLDQGDLVFRAQRDDQLLVRLLLARLVEHAHVRLASVERLGRLAQTAGETVVDQGDAEDTFREKSAQPRFQLTLPMSCGSFSPFSASRTDMDPEEAPASPETSTSSAAGTGEVGSSPSDYT